MQCSTKILLDSRSADGGAEEVLNDAEARPGVIRGVLDDLINNCRQ
jgi:hypothetical protein